jgi:protein phosphatase
MTAFLDFAEVSRTGGRSENEDRYGHLLLPDGALFVVADGMGGHRGGALAAGLFTRHALRLAGDMAAAFATRPVAAIKQLVHDAAAAMISDIREQAPKLDPRTTCVMVWVARDLVVSAHAGDSRLYVLDPERVIYQSRDHSLVQKLVESGSIEPHEQAIHPDRNQVYRSIGGKKPPAPTVRKFPALTGRQMLVLCTDGFWQQVQDWELRDLCKEPDLHRALVLLADLAVVRAGEHGDNMTVLAVQRRR